MYRGNSSLFSPPFPPSTLSLQTKLTPTTFILEVCKLSILCFSTFLHFYIFLQHRSFPLGLRCSQYGIHSTLKFLSLNGRVRRRSHLVPEQCARLRYSVGTNMNTRYFQVPTVESGHDCVPVPSTRSSPSSRAQQRALGPCVHTGFVSFGIVYCCVLTAIKARHVSKCLYCARHISRCDHSHLFVPLPRHWFLGTICGQPLSFVLKSARNNFAPETQKETC